MTTSRTGEKFRLSEDVRKKAIEATIKGHRILVEPLEMVVLMDTADRALNGDSCDAEHDALYLIREKLSAIFEGYERRRSGGSR